MRLRYWIVTGLDMLCAWLDRHRVTWRIGNIGKGHWLHEQACRLENRWHTGAFGPDFGKP